jgi:hypothetical protein
MHTGLVLASLAASVVAESNLMAMPAVRRHVEARQGLDFPIPTEGPCATAALDLITNFPTPAPEIVQDLVSNPQTDACDFTTPASLSKEYASYNSELLDWISGNQGKLSTALEQCPQFSSYAAFIPVCTVTTDGTPVVTTPGASHASTPGASHSGGSHSSKTESEAPATSTPGGDSGAARQGGAAALALAVAGLAIAL